MPTSRTQTPRPTYSPTTGPLANVGYLNWSPPEDAERQFLGILGRTQEGYRQAAQNASAAGGAGGASRSALINAIGNTEGQRAYDQAYGDFQNRDLAAQSLRLQDAQAGLQDRQFGATLGENQYQFSEDLDLRDRLGTGQLNLGRDQLALEAELGRGGLDLSRQQLAENMRQFDMGYGLDQQKFNESMRQFGLGFGEGQRQFDISSQIDRDQLNELIRQSDRNFGLDERRLQQAADQFAEGNVQNLLNNLVGGFFGMDINPADYMEVLSALSRGDYSVLENMPQFASANRGNSGGSGGGGGNNGGGSGSGGNAPTPTTPAPTYTPNPTTPKPNWGTASGFGANWVWDPYTAKWKREYRM